MDRGELKTRRWRFDRQLDGLIDFEEAGRWYLSSGLRPREPDPESVFEVLLVKREKAWVRDGTLRTSVWADELTTAPEVVKSLRPQDSLYWAQNPAGGGVAWRAADQENAYVATCDFRARSVSVFRLREGRPELLGSAGMGEEISCHLAVEFRGTDIVVSLNHPPETKTSYDAWKNQVEVLRLEDSVFAGPGRVGVAAYGNSLAKFEHFDAEWE